MANTLTAVLSQRLIPAIGGGRGAAMEILLGTTAVKTSIREGKSHMIANVIQTSAELGMQSLEQDLAHLVKSKTIELSVAGDYALSPLEFNRLVSK